MKCLLTIALTLYATCMAASANLIALNTVYYTGEDTATNSTGSYDTNWSIVSYDDWYNLSGGGTTTYSPANPAYLVTNYPGPNTGYWVANSSSGKWIAPQPVQGNGGVGTGAAPGIYDYQLQFAVTGTVTVHVSGQYAADNQFGIIYNGTTVEVSGPSGGTSTDPASSSYIFSKTNSTSASPTSQFGGTYGSNAPISFSFYATATGTTTIDFLVNNIEESSSSPYNNASGLFVQGLEIQQVPEPSTWAILVAGLGLLALAQARASRAMSPIPQAGKVTSPAPES